MNSNWPLPLRWLDAQGIGRFVPWHFLSDDGNPSIDERYRSERTDSSEVRTFAHRQDCDDFAGFVVVGGQITDQIIYFHPSFQNAPNEYLVNSRHDNLWDFLRDVVIPDTQEWASEDDLKDLTQ